MADTKDTNTSQITEEVISEKAIEAIAPYIKRLGENIKRVIELVTLWISLKQSEDFSSNMANDEILRAAVVFTHATLEDFLRTLAAKLLPESNEQTLNQIPLMGLEQSSSRTEKFSLGKLVQFKGKTVDEVITGSVLNYLEHSNFNSADDIAILIKSLNLDLSKANHSFPKLQELMKRRHLIVHRADRLEPIGSDEQSVSGIDSSDVLGWLAAVLQFIQDILPSAATKHLIISGYIKEEADTLTLSVPKIKYNDN